MIQTLSSLTDLHCRRSMIWSNVIDLFLILQLLARQRLLLFIIFRLELRFGGLRLEYVRGGIKGSREGWEKLRKHPRLSSRGILIPYAHCISLITPVRWFLVTRKLRSCIIVHEDPQTLPQAAWMTRSIIIGSGGSPNTLPLLCVSKNWYDNRYEGFALDNLFMQGQMLIHSYIPSRRIRNTRITYHEQPSRSRSFNGTIQHTKPHQSSITKYRLPEYLPLASLCVGLSLGPPWQ